MATKKKPKSKQQKSKAAKSSAPKQRVALYGLEIGTEKGDMVRNVLSEFHVPVVNITDEWLGSPVGAIAGMPGFRMTKLPFEGELDCDEFMLLCNLGQAQTNELLAAMRALGCSVGCKAMVTQHNRLWPVGTLIREVSREHNLMNAAEGDGPVSVEEVLEKLE